MMWNGCQRMLHLLRRLENHFDLLKVNAKERLYDFQKILIMKEVFGKMSESMSELMSE